MKKIVVLVCTLLLSMGVACSATQNSELLSGIEKQVFGYEYTSDSDLNRVVRLENYLYGANSSGDTSVRVKKISSDIGLLAGSGQGSAPNSGKKIASNSQSKSAQVPKTYPKEDSSVQYPIVDEIEQSVFHKTYNGQSVYARLDRLEQQVFKSTSSDDLSTRVDKLRTAVLGSSQDSIASSQSDDSDSSFVDNSADSQSDSDSSSGGWGFGSSQSGSRSSLDNQNSYSSARPSQNAYLSSQLTSLEKHVLKSSYEYDGVPERLDRLEDKVFHRTFDNDSPENRMQRIAAASSAHKTAKSYDGNKITRNLSTGVQIGGFLLMILAMFL